jgi:methyl-accepting chemotaxis protein
VRDGPFAATGLGRAARRALDGTADNEVYAEDFELYAPSRGRPTAFLASPVRVDGKTVGALVAQVPAGHVNALLAPEPGTSPSSETYLVGRDRLMRSDSRFERESTILRKSLDSLAVRESLAGNTGVGIAPDYRGVEGIISWTPVKVLGLDFGLVRKIDTEHAFEPSRRLLYWMAGIAGLLVLLALGAGIALSRSLARPVAEATERLQGMAQSLLSTAQQQQAGAAEAAAAVEETRQTFTSVLGAAKDLRKVGTEVLGNAEISQRNAQTIGRRIQDLSTNTAHIGEILSLVKEIANRSDLLALNAALEGTKAGEAGRGFSLVATQMQRLAEEVMQSVKKIEALTGDISKASAGAVLAAEEADKVASRTTTSAQHIAEAVETQQAATEQVSVAMNEIATVAQNSVESARTIVSSSNGLLGVAADLRRVMGSD